MERVEDSGRIWWTDMTSTDYALIYDDASDAWKLEITFDCTRWSIAFAQRLPNLTWSGRQLAEDIIDAIHLWKGRFGALPTAHIVGEIAQEIAQKWELEIVSVE